MDDRSDPDQAGLSPQERITRYLVLGGGGDPWRFLILPSAYRHRVGEDDMIHAITHYLKLFDAGEGMTMVLGQASNAQLLEVGIVVWCGDLAIVHAMPARPQFRTFLE